MWLYTNNLLGFCIEVFSLLHPSVWSILDFSVSQLQQVTLFFTGWCDHHECTTFLIFRFLHTSIIIFVWFININTIWELLIVETSLVFIVNVFWRCIHFRNISMKIIAPFWHDYLHIFICRIIYFTVQIYSHFLIALKRSLNPAWWGFEFVKPQTLCKLRAFIFHKNPPHHTIVFGIFMCMEIQVLDQFLFNFHIFTAAASHNCICFQFPVIKFYKPPPKILLLNFCFQ